jgi:hypothetical protein
MRYFYSLAHKSIRLTLVVAMLWLPVFAQANCLLMLNMSHGAATDNSSSQTVSSANQTPSSNMYSSHQHLDAQPVGNNAALTEQVSMQHHGQNQNCDGECFNCASCAPTVSASHTYKPAVSAAAEPRSLLVEPFTGDQSPPFRPPIG